MKCIKNVEYIWSNFFIWEYWKFQCQKYTKINNFVNLNSILSIFLVSISSSDLYSLNSDATKSLHRTTPPGQPCLSPCVPVLCISTRTDICSLAFISHEPVEKVHKWSYHNTEGLILVTGQFNGRIRLWRIENGKW